MQKQISTEYSLWPADIIHNFLKISCPERNSISMQLSFQSHCFIVLKYLLHVYVLFLETKYV